jgi:hypothetical protein
MKPFIGELAKKGGFNQHMDMDEYITKSVNSVRDFIAAINGGASVVHIT